MSYHLWPPSVWHWNPNKCLCTYNYTLPGRDEALASFTSMTVNIATIDERSNAAVAHVYTCVVYMRPYSVARPDTCI